MRNHGIYFSLTAALTASVIGFGAALGTALSAENEIEDWWSGRWAGPGGDCKTNYIEIAYADGALGVVFTRPDGTEALNFDVDYLEGLNARVVNRADGAVWDITFLDADHHTSSNDEMSIDWYRCFSRST